MLPGLNNSPLPGYRKIQSLGDFKLNPFEPVTDTKADTNTEAAQAMLKRIKGYVVQGNGSPLLIIDGKSYRVKDKVPMNSNADATKTKDANGKDTTAAPIGGETVTILSITPTEAVFQKDDPSGFGGESFKIFFDFKHQTDDAGKTNYNLWDIVGTGFFINEEGVVVAPLSLCQNGELSILTPYGYTRATLVESDNKRGLALLKTNMKSLPLILSETPPEMAEALFPAGYSATEKSGGLKFLEGFVKEIKAGSTSAVLSPELDGALLGSALLNAKAEAVGIVLGDTQKIDNVVLLSAKDPIFRKYPATKNDEKIGRASRATIEQSVVKIYKKR
jgi:hypothetical protein